ncbi:glycosyltransferase family 4 protein [Flavobacterium gyeonganense]|uniref:Glycosyltransferase family 4 protein n=1 Tax=Flavobacterium gyeonganense TaxID=1310418 RepID=A0ABV5H975_9FLAO|nr:glycosyltransferase family 4 protein [Flavobacterium gyeonganense]
MKIAFIIPSLANQGPVIVVKDLINELIKKVDHIDVYYFDENPELKLACTTTRISFREKIKFDDYDIIHTHMLRPDLYIWYHSKSVNRAKCVSTLHQDIFQNLKSSYNFLIAAIFEKIWIESLKSKQAIVTLTHTMRNQYAKKIKVSKLHTIYNGRPFFQFDELKEIDEMDKKEIIKLKKKYKIIGISALLTKRKGIAQIIMALPYLNDFALIVIGNGKEKDNLVKLAANLKISHKILFLGYRLEAIRYFKFFDFYAMSSYSEGFPLSLLEAGNASLPTLCSNIPIFKELFSKNEVSFFELDDVKSLVNSIINLEKNSEMFSQNIYKKVNKLYSVNNMSENYLLLYEKMLK